MTRLTQDTDRVGELSPEPSQDGSEANRRRGHRRARWIVAAALVAVAAVGTAVILGTGDGDADGSAEAGPRGTTEVVQRDLIERETFDGTLGYADASTVITQLPGTLTSIAAEGELAGRGDELFRVANQPVILLYGPRPAWRSLFDGVEDGPDVGQLERNLIALGYDPDGEIEVDGEFDWATENAVDDWQEDLGLDEDGAVELGEVVFLPGRVRVGELDAILGGLVGPGSAVLEVSALERVVTVELDADRQDLVSRGDDVQVELPDGQTVPGRITQIGSVAQTDPEDPEAEPFLEVTIKLKGDEVTGGLDQAPVDVDISTERRRDVLAVPVSALLALAEGGYGLEVVEANGSTRLIAVETGMFADGFVEVSGDGVTEGLEVAVPS